MVESKMTLDEGKKLLSSQYQDNSGLISLLEPEKGLPPSIIICLALLVWKKKKKSLVFFRSRIRSF